MDGNGREGERNEREGGEGSVGVNGVCWVQKACLLDHLLITDVSHISCPLMLINHLRLMNHFKTLILI